MYGMLKATIDRLARKIDFVQKYPQKWLFWCARIWVTWLWKDLDARPLTSGHFLGCPWKLWGITLQTSYMEGRLHQNWAHTSLLHFLVCVHGTLRKSYFLGKALCTQKFSTEKFFWAATLGILTLSVFKKCSRYWWLSLRFEVIAAQSEVTGQKPVVLQKSKGIMKN